MASKGVNKVILLGHLGNDPEVRYSATGTAMANVNLATNERWLDKQTNQWQDRTEWHRLVMFARTAEIAGEYLRKGSQIYVEGRLQTRKWQDQSGVERYTTEVVVLDLQMLGGGRSDAMNANYGAPASAPPAQYAPSGNPNTLPPASHSNYNNPPPAAPPAATGGGQNQPASSSQAPPADFDDDIPF